MDKVAKKNTNWLVLKQAVTISKICTTETIQSPLKITKMKRSIQIAAIMLLLFACKKDNDSDPSGGKTKPELLSANAWKLTSSVVNPAYDVNGDGVLVTDAYASMPSCSKDDLYLFKTNGDIVYDEGPSKCDPSNPQSYTDGKWKLLNNDAVLDLDGESYQVTELTTNKLTLKRTWSENNKTYTEMHSFSH